MRINHAVDQDHAASTAGTNTISAGLDNNNNAVTDSPRSRSRSPSLSLRRASSLTGKVRVQTILGEILAIEADPTATEEAKKRGRQLLDSCVKKVGLTASRTAYLACREEHLADGEKCELLFLKYAELARRQLRRGSLVPPGAPYSSSPFSPMNHLPRSYSPQPAAGSHRAAGGASGSISSGSSPSHRTVPPNVTIGSTSCSSPLPGASLRKSVFDGVPAAVGQEVEHHLADFVYACQVFTEASIGIPREFVAPLRINLSDGVLAEHAFAQYLTHHYSSSHNQHQQQVGAGGEESGFQQALPTSNLLFTISRVEGGSSDEGAATQLHRQPSSTIDTGGGGGGGGHDANTISTAQLCRASEAGPASPSKPMGGYVLTVPIQDRAAQRLQHLVHSTLASPEFLAVLQAARRKQQQQQQALGQSVALLNSPKGPQGRSAVQLCDAESSPLPRQAIT
jgi:hypothetical protein